VEGKTVYQVFFLSLIRTEERIRTSSSPVLKGGGRGEGIRNRTGKKGKRLKIKRIATYNRKRDEEGKDPEDHLVCECFSILKRNRRGKEGFLPLP